MRSMKGEHYTVHSANPNEQVQFIFEEAEKWAESYESYFADLNFGRISYANQKSWFLRLSPRSRECWVVNRSFVVGQVESFLDKAIEQMFKEQGEPFAPELLIYKNPLFAPAMAEALQGRRSLGRRRIERERYEFVWPSFTGRGGQLFFDVQERPEWSPFSPKKEGKKEKTKGASHPMPAGEYVKASTEPGVYVYSYPAYISQTDNEERFLVKIGYAMNVARRVRTQARHTEVPEDLVLLRTYPTPDARANEGLIHQQLKAMGRHHRTTYGGVEWFVASLKELDAMACELQLTPDGTSEGAM